MAFIQITQIKGGAAGCSDYFFKEGVPDKVCRILPGEVAYVPDSELDTHLATELVTSVDGRAAKSKVVNPEDVPTKEAKAE